MGDRIIFDDGRHPIELSEGADAVIELPRRATLTYRIVGDGLPSADPHNADSAGELGSLLTGPDVVRDGVEGIDLWAPRSADTPPELPRHRIRLDRGVLGRRLTLRHNDIPKDIAPEPIPVVVLLDGDDWTLAHDAPSALQRAVNRGYLPPHLMVIVPGPTPRARLDEFSATAVVDALNGPIIDAVDAALQAAHCHRGHTVVAGQSLSAIAALRAALHPDSHYDTCLLASPSFWWPAPTTSTDPLAGPAGGALVDEAAAPCPAKPQTFVRVGTGEPAMHRHVDAVVEALRANDMPVTSTVVPGGHDHSVWRTGLLADLATALSARESRAAP